MEESSTGCGSNHHSIHPKCKILVDLERSEEVYYGGQYLKGVAKVELENPLDITGMKLRIFGGSCVKWALKKTKQSSRHNEWFKEEEVYFDESFILWGQDNLRLDSSLIEQLPKGRHLFPFNWLIPTDLPSSFEGSLGWIRYYAQCILLTPGCRNTCKTCFVRTKYFTVLRHLDLNSKILYKECSRVSKDINLNSHFCKGGKISISMSSPRAGYVCGENITVDIDIHNSSSKKVKTSSIALRQIVKYGATDDSDESRVEMIDMDSALGDSIRSKKHQCWSCRSLQIPPTIPSDTTKCSIIDIKYELVLTLSTPPYTLSVDLPVYIGTIPAKDSYLTTWTYKEPELTDREKLRRKTTRRDSGQLGRGNEELPVKTDGTPFLPKFRFYHQVTPRLKTKAVLPMESSPRQRRRRSMYVCRTIRLKSHQWENMESVV